MPRIVSLIIAIAIPLAVGSLGRAITDPAIPDWYQTLEKPALTPPDWVFPVVWTVLFVLMGIASWIVWRRGGLGAWLALGAYALQLALNAGWSYLFFGKQDPQAALMEIVALICAILLTMVLFARWSSLAVLLLVPYALWTGFAAWLNYTIVALNT